MIFTNIISKWAEINPSREFISDITTERSLTFSELNDITYRVANALKSDFDVKQGSVISVKSTNSIEFVILFFSIIRCGAAVSPIPHSFTESETFNVVQNTQSTLFFHEDRGALSHWPCKALRINSFFESLPRVDRDSTNEQLEHDDAIAAIFLSSGSKGSVPKAIAHTNKSLVSMAGIFSKSARFMESSVHFAFLPCGNTSFIGHTLIPMLYSGGKILLARNYIQVSRRFWDLVIEHNVDFIQVVPPIAQAILQNTVILPERGRLTYISCGSAPLSEKLQDDFKSTVGLDLLNIYGTSEIGAMFFNDRNDSAFDRSSIGKVFSTDCVKLVGNCVNSTSEGVLHVRSPHMFSGYVVDGVLQSNHLDSEGFFNTHDILKKCGDNFYYIGRKDNLLIRGGVNISPEEIELAFKDFGYEVLVVSEEKDVLGDVLTCYYESSDEVERNGILLDIATTILSPLKVPRYFRLVKNFVRTSTGKVKRSAYANQI